MNARLKVVGSPAKQEAAISQVKNTGRGRAHGDTHYIRVTKVLDDSRTIDKSAARSFVVRLPVEARTGEQKSDSQNTDKGGTKRRSKRSVGNIVKWSVLSTLLVAGLTAGFNAYRFFSAHEETDDATIVGHLHMISSRIAGNVRQVLVDDNQRVTQGQVLVRLEPEDYSVLVDQAKAELAVAQRQAEVARAHIDEMIAASDAQSTKANGDVTESVASLSDYKVKVVDAQAGLSAATEQLAQAQATRDKDSADYKRYAFLAHEGAVPVQQLDNTRRDLRVSEAAVRAAQDGISQAKARVAAAKEAVMEAAAHVTAVKSEVHQARASAVQIETARKQYEADLATVQQAQAKLQNAQLQQSYTDIVAPISGTIGTKNVEEGQRLQPGQQIMAIVPDNSWVVANFKETQLERMQVGEPVEIKVDAFPHHVFTGKVNSLSPASGADFALLPPDNATGNFTKIVQRVPVKIVFDKDSIKGYEDRLTPGMSVIATVQVSK